MSIPEIHSHSQAPLVDASMSIRSAVTPINVVLSLLSLQFCSSTTKRDWLTDLRLCKMCLDSDNQPAWETLPSLANDAQLVVNKHPLLSKVMPLFQATSATEVNCGCYYTALSKPNGEKSFQVSLQSEDIDHNNNYLFITFRALFRKFLSEVFPSRPITEYNVRRKHAQEAHSLAASALPLALQYRWYQLAYGDPPTRSLRRAQYAARRGLRSSREPNNSNGVRPATTRVVSDGPSFGGCS